MNQFAHFGTYYQERGMCQRFVEGKCPFSALTCIYSHNKDMAPICIRWTQGQCIGASANRCLFRHYYLERDAANQSRRPVRTPLAQVQADADFSSPFRLNILTEKISHRRVEVDLETGGRRSWVEEEEREVMDLTGETPVKPKLPPTSSKLPATSSMLPATSSMLPATSGATSSKHLPSPMSMLDLGFTTPGQVTLEAMQLENSILNSPDSACGPSAPEVDANSCPVCGRGGFSGAKGVARHRYSRTSKCKVDKADPTPVPMVPRSPNMFADTPEVSLTSSSRLRSLRH